MNKQDDATWRLGADIGGTFTDVVLERGHERFTAKNLTTHEAPEERVLLGVRQVLEEAGVDPGEVGQIIHGTTLATNALIERRGAKCALITTEGFRDVLEMGTESRFDHYDLNLQKPAPLIPRQRRFTVAERLDADGGILVELDEAALAGIIDALKGDGVESVAIAFLHAFVNPAHEIRVREILQAELPEVSISLSSEVSPEIREYDRFSTTAANAYVAPKVAPYLRNLERRLGDFGIDAALYLMLSNGGICDLDTACRFPIRLVESGPAGGAILAGHIARQCGLDKVMSYDMGGTTAKICLIDEARPSTAREFEVAREQRFKRGSGLPLRVPVIELVEIGAGGGSICALNSLGLISVGPESAGSDPGPACYGLGGEAATVTDANLLLGRIAPDLFAGGRMALSPAAAEEALNASVAAALKMKPEMAAAGVIEMVDENMTNAAREHAVERGKSIDGRTMIAFGGSAPLHAARLAQKLGMRRIVVPTGAGVGSAIGFLRAAVAFEVVRSLYQRLGNLDLKRINRLLEEMASEATEFVAKASGGDEIEVTRTSFMRFVGQSHEIAVALPSGPLMGDMAADLRQAFNATYQSQFGRAMPEVEIEIVNWSVSASAGRPALPADEHMGGGAVSQGVPERTQSLWDPALGKSVDAKVYARAELGAGAEINGPALIVEDETTTVVPSAFRAVINEFGYIVLETP